MEVERAHAFHILRDGRERDQYNDAAEQADGRQEQHGRAEAAGLIGQIADQWRRERVPSQMRKEHEGAEYGRLHRSGHDVENDGNERSVVPCVEEIRHEHEWAEPAEIVNQDQGYTDRSAQHETRSARENTTAAPALLQPVREPPPEQRARHPARESPHAKLRPYARD